MAFYQAPPSLGNQSILTRCSVSTWNEPSQRSCYQRFEPEYRELGELNGGELYRLAMADLENEPVHTVWDAWGNRIDEVEVTEVWKRAQVICASTAWLPLATTRSSGPSREFISTP